MYSLLRGLLFLLPEEASHDFALHAMRLAHKLKLISFFAPQVPSSPVHVMGLDFPNPVGLAAGLDKNGDYIDALGSLGFGFIEIGTITPKPQPGNPSPRLFRLPQAEAIINRMGFNNKGVDYLVRQVKGSDYKGILGINIGKNKDTPAENAVDDYLCCMQKVYPHASYITVNLSSPNTPGLRDLQFGEPLEKLIETLMSERSHLAEKYNRQVPLAVKIAPDMNAEDVQQVAQVFLKFGVDAVIATNTTIARDGVRHLKNGDQTGGLSGRPLLESSNTVLEQLVAELDGRIPVIGVGGILSGQSAEQKVVLGASLLQVYSGFIYKGPALIREAVNAIKSR